MEKFQKYLDPKSSASFTGLSSYTKTFKTSTKEKKNLSDWLLNQETYTLHRPIRKKFKRRKVVVSGIDDLWQADLVDVSKISKDNNGIKFLLTVIDVFSKIAWVLPLKNKNSETIFEAFKKLLNTRKPKRIQTDKGKEFLNSQIQNYLKKLDIHFYTINSELKACVVERFNRTLKEKMWRYFTFKNTNKFIDVLDDLVESYNNTYHRTIKTKPSLVNIKNEAEIWKNIYGYDKHAGDETLLNPKFNVGDKVRISKNKGIFEKGYTPNWTREIFLIEKIYYQDPPVYTIKDLNDEIIEGKFYEFELQKINQNEEIYAIDKILKKRKRNNKLEYFVSWLGYPNSFNSWISANDLVQQ